MNIEVKEFQKKCRLFETQIRNFRKDYQTARFDYSNTLEDISACAYYQSRELNESEKLILKEKSHAYISKYLQYLELKEKYLNFCEQFDWVRAL